MKKDDGSRATNIITVEGVIFKTSGNIVFSDTEENPFYLAQSSLLEKIDGCLENGMQQLLQKLST